MELMTISEAARRLGYKSRSQLYRLINDGYLHEHVHVQQHTGQRWTCEVSAAIAVVGWALRRFRQMDTVQSSPTRTGTPPWGGTLRAPALIAGCRVYLSDPVQSHCTAGDPSRQHPCLSVSMVSDLLLGGQVVNR